MWKYLFLVVVALLLLNSYLFNFLAPVLKHSKFFCLNLYNEKLADHELYRAFVCGDSSFRKSPAASSTIATLYPMLAFSGLQIFLFERFLIFLLGARHRLGPALVIAIAGFSAFVFAFSPAMIRAWLHQILKRAVRQDRLSWPPALTSLVLGACCILISPMWLVNQAFLLCWVGALMFQLHFRRFKTRALVVFIGMAPLLGDYNFGGFSDSSLKLILKPIANILVWPILIAVAAAPSLANQVAPFWPWAAQELRTVVSSSPNFTQNELHSFLMFLYALFVHLLALAYDRWQRQQIFWPKNWERYFFALSFCSFA